MADLIALASVRLYTRTCASRDRSMSGSELELPWVVGRLLVCASRRGEAGGVGISRTRPRLLLRLLGT